jgi:hypothetical protein
MTAAQTFDDHDPRAEAIYTLSQTPELLQQLILDVAETRLDQAPPGEWSARMVLAHMLSTEWQIFRVRLERTLTEDQPHVPLFDEHAWGERFGTLPLELGSKIVTDLTVQRAASVRMLENLQDADWARAMVHPERGLFTLDDMLQLWANHDQNHLNQLTALLDITE